jgi:hypothetical protein
MGGSGGAGYVTGRATLRTSNFKGEGPTLSGALDFSRVSISVRADVVEAHEVIWARIARPGTWWTGVERVAIAAEVRAARDCALCAQRRRAISPNAMDGAHDRPVEAGESLSGSAVDAVHRITTDAGRLSRAWVEKLEADGLSDAHYVELLGIVVAITSIDFVCRGLGVPLHPLPDAEPGAPTRNRPAAALHEGAFVPMLPAAAAVGAESDLWGRQTGNVIRAMSLVPDAVRDLQTLSAAHYLPEHDFTDVRAGRTLSRPQMELIAGRVSALNECFY